MPTLFVTDLDGTLIRDDLTLSSEARVDRCALLADSLGGGGMMKGADRPIAMANAKPGVKALAREVIGTNDEDSVVRRIRRDWSGKGGR